MRYFSFLILSAVLLASCRPETYTPKPRGYYRISFPKHEYTVFNDPAYPYSFQYPKYASLSKDTVFFNEKPENPYWLNMSFGELGGQLYLTYKEISPKQDFTKLMEDAYKMSSFHNKRANYIIDHSFRTSEDVFGIFYNVGGDAASNYQFCVTDSAKHFLWGSLYFDTTPNADSLKPVTDFIKKDLDHLLATFVWKKN